VLDFAAAHSFGHTRRVLRNLEVARRISHRQLRATLDAHPSARGTKTIRRLLRRGPAPTRSSLEDAILDLLDNLGAPRPEPNARTAGREFDLTWPEHKVILEIDPEHTHGTPTTDAIDREKQEAAESAGFVVMRVAP
jgi:hypothetical protein